MIHKSTTLFLNRDHAAQHLISKLGSYKNKNCCIVAVSNGAVVIARHIARRLNADLAFMPIERINDPADPLKSIGVVGFDYCITDDFHRDVPQDYIYRKTRALQSKFLSRYPDVHSFSFSTFQDKTIILVDDFAERSDKILACLRIICRQNPHEIIVAVPVVTPGDANKIILEADSVVFVHAADARSIKKAYLDFDSIRDEEVAGLMNLSDEGTIESRLLNLHQFKYLAHSSL